MAELPASFHYNEETSVLSIHTNSGGSPTTHEIEVIRRDHGIVMFGRPYVTVAGFFLRHTGE